MHPDTRAVAEHMRDFGLHVLGRAIYEATFSEMMTPYAHALGVTHAAHGAELVIKARIAQEHPLLIFDDLPRSTAAQGALLELRHLLAGGRTVNYADLPEMLWATTGYRMRNPARFLEFGRLRNQVMHFAVPDEDLAAEVLEFCCCTMDQTVGDLWENESVLAYSTYYDSETLDGGYLIEQLTNCGLELSQETRDRLQRIRPSTPLE